MVTRVGLGDRWLGEGQACLVIAEAGVNHNGDADLACRLVDAAADAGADAVKFQTFRAERLVTAAAAKAGYQARTTGADESQFAMLKRLELPADGLRRAQARCRERGIMFLSSPFDEDSADELAELGVPAFKLGSGELTNLPLIAHVARFGRPLLLSTGMATLEEVGAAVTTATRAGAGGMVLLQCTSNYPAAPADVNLRAMRTLRETFGVPCGFSDHTIGRHIAVAAVALGACVVEKHLTLDRAMPGPDHQASIEPRELQALVHDIREVEQALGSGIKAPAASEADVARAARRSLVAAVDIAAGSVLTGAHVTLRRPGTGLPPSALDLVLGKVARRAIQAGQLIEHGALRDA